MESNFIASKEVFVIKNVVVEKFYTEKCKLTADILQAHTYNSLEEAKDELSFLYDDDENCEISSVTLKYYNN